MTTLSRRTLIRAGVGSALIMNSCFGFAANRPAQIGIVAKARIPWFDNVEKGIKRAAAELGLDAWMIAPSSDDPAQQVRAVEDLIAKRVDVIGVIPNDGPALEPVFQRAHTAGIKIITEEQPKQVGADWDIELIRNKGFGEMNLEALAGAMNGEGKYIVFVGGLTVALHNAWADAALALQKQKYPRMRQVGERFGVSNSVEDSYNAAVDQMRANPDLKGILAFGANGPIGAGHAVTDRDKIGKVCVVGPFVPSQGKSLMKSGAILRGYLWNPIDAGYAMVQLANLLVQRKPINDGMSISGLGRVAVDLPSHTVWADKTLDINPRTIDQLALLI